MDEALGLPGGKLGGTAKPGLDGVEGIGALGLTGRPNLGRGEAPLEAAGLPGGDGTDLGGGGGTGL